MKLLTDEQRESNRKSLAASKEFRDLKLELTSEIKHCWEHLAKDATLTPESQQFWRRATVRVIFAAIEGEMYFLKRIALEQAALFGVQFTPGEISFLREEVYELNDKGSVVPQRAKISFIKNVRFALEMYARSAKLTSRADYSGQGWEYLRKSIKVRDRLMHPKNVQELHITRDEVADALEASTWFEKTSTVLLNESTQMIDAMTN
jgi:hypothetical protein